MLPQRWMGIAFIAAIAASVLLASLVPTLLTVVLPWLIIAGMVTLMSVRVQQQRAGAAMNQQAAELAMLRSHREALRTVWRVLPRLTRRPTEHRKAVGTLAQSLDALACHEAAVVAYDYLIARAAPEHPMRAELLLRKAVSVLAEDRLVDADDLLRQARGSIDASGDSPLVSLLTYAALLQHIKTHHDDDALRLVADDEPAFIEKLQPLGTQVGCAHALVALAGHRWIERLARREHERGSDGPSLSSDAALLPEAARTLAERSWRRATLLMPRERLVARHAELETIKLPPAQRPNLSLSLSLADRPMASHTSGGEA